MHALPPLQSTEPPQPSEMTPQFICVGHAWTGMQAALPPHPPGGPPPPRVCGAVHLPQSTVPPQPSLSTPQFFPPAHAWATVAGVHWFKPPSMMPPSGSTPTAPHWNGVPPPPHVMFD